LIEKLCASSNQLLVSDSHKQVNGRDKKTEGNFNTLFDNIFQNHLESGDMANILMHLFAALFIRTDLQAENLLSEGKNFVPNSYISDGISRTISNGISPTIIDIYEAVLKNNNLFKNIDFKDFFKEIINNSSHWQNNKEFFSKILEQLKNFNTSVDITDLTSILQFQDIDLMREELSKANNIVFDVNGEAEIVNQHGKQNKNDISLTKKEGNIILEKTTDPIINLVNKTFHNEEAVPNLDEKLVKATSDNLIKKMVEKIKVTNKNNVSELYVDLKPDFIGKVSIRIFSDNGRVEAKIFTDNSYIKNLVESNLNQLKEALINQGINITNLSVSMGSSGFYNENRKSFHDYKKPDFKSSLTMDEEDYRNLYEFFAANSSNQIDFIA